MFRDVLHRADHILQRRIVGSLHADAVAQHEHRVAHFVQVPCSGNALADLRADHDRITADHQRIFLVRLRPFCRQIIQFHTVPAGILRDLLRRIKREGHPLPSVIGADQIVQSIRRILCRPVIGKAAQRLRVPVHPVQHTVLLQRVGVDARTHNAGVGADLCHFGARCDVGLTKLLRKRRLCQQDHQANTKQYRAQSFSHSNPPFISLFAYLHCFSQNAVACRIQPSASVWRPGPMAWGAFSYTWHS